MTAIPSKPIPSGTGTSLPVEWEDLLDWIVRQLKAIPTPSAPIPDDWKILIIEIISQLEATFSRAYGAGDDKWEQSFRNAHEKSKEKMDAGAEKVIDHIKEMPEKARGPAAGWWKSVWEKITEFVSRMVNYIIGVARTVWERVKAWFARLKRAIMKLWADWMSPNPGQ